MNPYELLAKAGDLFGVRRAFGDPIPAGDGVLVPVAAIIGGGGGGIGATDAVAGATGRTDDIGISGGIGGGGGLRIIPVGAYHLRADGTVAWRPAVNVNQLVLAGNAVLALAILVLARRDRARRGCCLRRPCTAGRRRAGARHGSTGASGTTRVPS